jgi:hypothetical protein
VLRVANIVVLPLENWPWANNFGSVIHVRRYLIWEQKPSAIGNPKKMLAPCCTSHIYLRKYKCSVFLWYHQCSFLFPRLISLLDSSLVSGYQLHMVMPQVHGELLVRTLYVCLHDQTLCMRWTYGILFAYIFNLFMYHILKCADNLFDKFPRSKKIFTFHPNPTICH